MKHLLLLCSVILLLSTSLRAQQNRRGNGNDTIIKNTTLDVYQIYKPELKPYVRPELQPSLPPAAVVENEPAYNVPQQTLYFSYRSLPLRPLALGRDTTPPLKKNYVKIGGGNLGTFTAETGFGGIEYKGLKTALLAHFDSRDGDISNQSTLNAGGVADGRYSSQLYDYTGGIEVDHRRYYLYGYDHDTYHYNADDLSRPYTFIGAHAALRNRSNNAYGIDFAPAIKASLFFAKPIEAERSLELSLPFSKKIDASLTAALSFDDAFSELSNSNNGYRSNNVFSIRPAAIVDRGALQATIGITPAFGRGNSYLLPQITGNYKMPTTALAFSAGWQSAIIRNTFRELSLKNPFLQLPADSAMAQTRQDEVFAAAEAGVGAHLAFQARASYWHWNNLPIFINAPPDGKEFEVINDPHAKAISLQAGAKYQFAETFTLSANGTWYAYLNPTYRHIFGEPSIRLRGDLGWRLSRDLLVTAYMTWVDGIWALNGLGEDVKLKPTLDIGGSAEYNLIKQLSLFGNVANLLNNRNERWLGYSSFGFNIWAGLRFKF